jgi:hypothetical protein
MTITPIEMCVGDWVLVHVGFAMSRIDAEQATKTLKILEELGEMQMELENMTVRQGLTATADYERPCYQRPLPPTSSAKAKGAARISPIESTFTLPA